MYTPSPFAAPDQAALYALMRAYPLATLIVKDAHGLEVNHVPLLLTADGTLTGHLARANPLWRTMQSAPAVLAVFHGPQAYVSPSWYPAKERHGKGVPTWNYAVVHAQGSARVIETADWIQAHLAAMTAQHEAAFESPWRMEEAPPAFITGLLQAVVGIEITLTGLTGKWKLSQNQSAENQAGVMVGLRQHAGRQAEGMLTLMQQMTQSNRD